MKRNIVALIYDFDKTLTDKDMQDYGFIPSLGMTPEDFWRDCNNMAHEKKMDGILAMMYFMIERARGKSVLTADTLKELGKDVNYYPGVTEWFDAVNEYGKSKGVVIEHYIISSGLKKSSRARKSQRISVKFSQVSSFTTNTACRTGLRSR